MQGNNDIKNDNLSLKNNNSIIISSDNQLQKNIFSKAIGREIARLRKSKSLSGRELSLLLNISQQQISRYENAICNISIDNLMTVLVLLDISWNDFFQCVFTRIRENENKDIFKRYAKVITPSLVQTNYDIAMK
ncbi:helix-turn-helix domain-containing protein [Providencia sneebia]|nr:helix-turn-helix transcriptional regulator [Providencia sneebia]